MKFFNITLLATVSFILTWIPARGQVNAEQVMTIGRNVLSMDDYLLSIQYFNQAIKAKPYLADPYFYRALAKLQLDDYSGAVADCDAAIERNKFITEAYKLRGFARQRLGQDSLAIADYEYGLTYNPTDRYFLFYKATAEGECKRFEASKKTFSDLLRQYPKFEEGYAARGYYLLQEGDTVQALKDIDKSLELNRNMLNGHLMKAEVLAARQEWEEASEAMDKAVSLSPQDVSLYVNRAYLRYNLQDFFGAMADYNYALELEPENEAAIFNRALLRFEVRDYQNSIADFTHALQIDPDNFHALYNRALIYYRLDEYKKAIADLDKILSKYPKFYPVYYAKADLYQKMGNTRAAFDNYYKGEELVKRYVTDPERNPLDRPTIDAGKTNRRERVPGEEESEIEVMNRFNQLVTLSGTEEPDMAFNDRIKGRVQDRNLKVEPEPVYGLTLYDRSTSLRSLSNYFRELDELNSGKYLTHNLYLSNQGINLTDPEEIERLFRTVDDYNETLRGEKQRPVDLLGRGVVYVMLKNYESAADDFDRALEISPDFVVALMARGYMNYAWSHNQEMDGELHSLKLRQAMEDFDRAAQLDPRLVYAWFNKGVLLYETGDYTSAMECFTRAAEIDPAFGEAYYNRGLSYLQMGNKQPALQDLSRAGELGIPGAYNLLKRMY